MKEIAKFSVIVLFLSALLFGCTPPEDPIEPTTAVEEGAATAAPALQIITPQVTAALVIETEPTGTPENYPPPAPTLAPEEYPRATATPYDPYAEPEESSQSTDSANALESGENDEVSLADADVTFVRAVLNSDDSWTFHVTVAHPDTGEADYADGWDVITPDSEVLKADPSDSFTRLLLHPHVNEQPFTRSQNGITLPQGVNEVFVRAHDIVHGWGGQIVFVDLSQESGLNYVVER